MDKKLEQLLVRIAENLDGTDIVWGVGASVLLNQYSLVDNPSDIDIIVAVSDAQNLNNILRNISDNKRQVGFNPGTGIYHTTSFIEYNINGIDIDVMGGFKIELPEGIYEYRFDKESVPHYFLIKGTYVPFSTLEEWFVLYQLIPGRENKVRLIEEYFRENGIHYPFLLQRMIEGQALPEEVVGRVRRLLKP